MGAWRRSLRRTHLAKAVLALTMAPNAAASAEEHVVVLPAAQVQAVDCAGLVEALRIQLVGDARVSPGPPLGAGSLDERVREAQRTIAQEGATVGVWLESGSDQAEDVVLYAVRRNDARALIEVARVQEPPGPDRERALALKLGELLAALLAPPPPRAVAPRTEVITHQRLEPAPAPSRTRPLALELGGYTTFGAPSTGSWRPGLALGAAARLTTALELGVQARLLATEERAVGGAYVGLGGQEAALSGRWLAGVAPWLELGLAAEVGLRRIAARGIGADGRRGDDVRIRAAGAALVDLRLRLTSALRARAAAGIGLLDADVRYEVAGVDLLITRWWRPVGQLALLLFLP